jgi:membrane protein YdbS with pleckstrin-like domain
MRPRAKKLIGGVVLVISVAIYALVVMIVGQVRLAQSGLAVQLAYFAVFGLLWIVPAAFLIRWMERVDRKP